MDGWAVADKCGWGIDMMGGSPYLYLLSRRLLVSNHHLLSPQARMDGTHARGGGAAPTNGDQRKKNAEERRRGRSSNAPFPNIGLALFTLPSSLSFVNCLVSRAPKLEILLPSPPLRGGDGDTLRCGVVGALLVPSIVSSSLFSWCYVGVWSSSSCGSGGDVCCAGIDFQLRMTSSSVVDRFFALHRSIGGRMDIGCLRVQREGREGVGLVQVHAVCLSCYM